jgi:hypothetical protein
VRGTTLVLFNVGCAFVVLVFAVSIALRVHRLVRSGHALPLKLRVQAAVMGFTVAMLVVLVGWSVLGY